MERSDAMTFQVSEGAQVRSADNEKLGKVVAVEPAYLVVEKGFLFPTDYYIPVSAIANTDDGTVYLNVGKNEAVNSNWNMIPVADDTVGTTMTDTYAMPNRARDGVGMADGFVGSEQRDQLPYEHDSRATASHVHGDDELVVPVHEEELIATKRAVERGQVKVNTEVIAEERTLDVPVSEERVTVTRRAVDRDATGDETMFQGGTIEVPIRGEEVELQKRSRVVEEVEIGKEIVGRTERVAGTVRREEVRIDDNTTQTGGGLVDQATDTVDRKTGRRSTR